GQAARSPPEREAPPRSSSPSSPQRRAVPWVATASRRDSNRLGFEILLDPFQSPFATDAAALVAAERQIGRNAHAAVDRHRAGAYPARDAHRALFVGRDDHAAQPVLAVVGDADGVLVILVRDDGEHRPEYLLASDSHVVGDIDETGRLHEKAAALIGTNMAAGEEPRSFLLAELDVAHHAIQLTLGDDRPHYLRGIVETPPLGGVSGVAFLQCCNRLLIPLARYQEARRDGAALAGVKTDHGAHDAHGKIGCIVEDNRGRFAAELQKDPLEGRRALFHDALADGGGAGERDEIHPRVGHQHLARHRRIARGDDIEYAGGKSGL